MAATTRTFYIPDLIKLSNWPWPAILSPYYESVRRASQEWMESYKLLPSEALDAFNRCDFAMIMAYANNFGTEEHVRIAADICQWYFLYDEFSDVMDASATRELSDTLLLAMRQPHDPLPTGSHKLGVLTQDFWSRVLKFSVPSSALRLRKSLEEYIEAVCVEASDREELVIRSIQEYLQIRRGSAATRSIFLIGSLHVEIPDEVMQHPKVENLTVKCMDLVVIHNDLYSYNFERKHGIHGHNLITAVMKEKRLDIQGSFNYAGRMFQQIAFAFIKDVKQIPTFGPKVDKTLQFHLDVMCNWIIGMEEWTFRCERYFGKQAPEIRKTRTVELAPEPLRRQYDLLMGHLNTTVTKSSDLTKWSQVAIRATGLDSILRFTVPIMIYYSLTLLIYNVRN